MRKATESHLYALLRVIQKGKDVDGLRRLGLSFSQISLLTSEAVEDGYLNYDGDEIAVTELGYGFIENGYSKKLLERGWIRKETESQERRMSSQTAYFTPIRKSHFD